MTFNSTPVVVAAIATGNPRADRRNFLAAVRNESQSATTTLKGVYHFSPPCNLSHRVFDGDRLQGGEK
jgi:hypothetical protein